MTDRDDVALLRLAPVTRAPPWVRLGRWPTPVEPLPAVAAELWTKREDLSSPVYGGNKIRTLEALMGRAVAAGARRIWSTGAYGSNHAVATALHAPAAGLDAGAILFPQPASAPARGNLRALLSARPEIVRLPTVIALPFAMAAVARRPGAYVMPPGGATPEGALGAVSAALELGEQIARGDCPPPARLVLAVGSTCTTAGLLAGFQLAAALGLGAPAPLVTAVRVTPWPVTSAWRIVDLAARTLRLVESILGRRSDGDPRRALRARLDLRTDFFGGGYGRVTAAGARAMARFEAGGGPRLDVVYSAKAAAAALALAPVTRGPILFWATRSSAALPEPTAADVARAHPHMRAWLGA